jgi:hypothetical protein
MYALLSFTAQPASLSRSSISSSFISTPVLSRIRYALEIILSLTDD